MSDTDNRRTLTIKELKEATGLSISTLRRRVKDGTLPVIQAGGRGKKLLFPATVIDELCTGRAAQPDVTAHDRGSEGEDAGQCLPRPAGECVEAGHTAETHDVPFQFGGVTRPEAGPIPNWIRSPLLKKCESNQTKSENKPCQNNAKTN